MPAVSKNNSYLSFSFYSLSHRYIVKEHSVRNVRILTTESNVNSKQEIKKLFQKNNSKKNDIIIFLITCRLSIFQYVQGHVWLRWLEVLLDLVRLPCYTLQWHVQTYF